MIKIKNLYPKLLPLPSQNYIELVRDQVSIEFWLLSKLQKFMTGKYSLEELVIIAREPSMDNEDGPPKKLYYDQITQKTVKSCLQKFSTIIE
jgi:hypothetical protein